jgi:hypothetical protein
LRREARRRFGVIFQVAGTSSGSTDEPGLSFMPMLGGSRV